MASRDARPSSSHGGAGAPPRARGPRDTPEPSGRALPRHRRGDSNAGSGGGGGSADFAGAWNVAAATSASKHALPPRTPVAAPSSTLAAVMESESSDSTPSSAAAALALAATKSPERAAIAERLLHAAACSPSSVAAASSSPACASVSSGSLAAGPFTIYHRGYLKQKATSIGVRGSSGGSSHSGSVTVVRGKAGTSRYFVWHSKGLSVYASERAYERDQRPERQFLNAWNLSTASNATTAEEEPEQLVLVPYTQGDGYTDDSASLLVQAALDERLLRLLLCVPSALASVHSLPPTATLMLLKAPDSAAAKSWLAASSRIRYARTRDRSMHADILPLLHALLEDPNGFLTTHATATATTTAAAPGAAPAESRVSPPRALSVTIPPSPVIAHSVMVPAKQSPPSIMRELVLPRQPFDDDGNAEPEAEEVQQQQAPPPRTASSSPSLSLSTTTTAGSTKALDIAADLDSVSASPTPSRINSASAIDPRSMGMPAFRLASPSPSPSPGPFTMAYPPPPSPLLSSSTTPTVRPPRVPITPHASAAASSSAEQGFPCVAGDPTTPATNTCEFYGLNGETPLYPALPLSEVAHYALVPASEPLSPSSTATTALVQLDMLGPRRCGVHDLLHWILLQYPGSTFTLPVEERPLSPLSPSNPNAASPSSSLWSVAHLEFAFLLFRGAYLPCAQLVASLREMWLDVASDELGGGAHEQHHIRANILHLLLVWIEHFRRDYLEVKMQVDAFLIREVYPAIAEFEASKHERQSMSCAEWTTAAASSSSRSSSSPPRCLDLTALAARLSSVIALTSGSSISVLSEMMELPATYQLGGCATPKSAEVADMPMPQFPQHKPTHTRAVSSPLVRRATFIGKSPLFRGNAHGATPPPMNIALASHLPPPPLGLGLGSQAHRPPACFALRSSSLSFLRKFVGFGLPAKGGLLAFHPTALAAELTHLDREALQCVHVRELVHKAWTARDRATRVAQAGSIGNFIESFNRRSFWTASEVLRAGTTIVGGDSAQALSAALATVVHLISVASELARLCNFYGSFALVTGLGLQPLFRLTKLWKMLPERDAEKLRLLREGLCSPTGNFAQYRAVQRDATARGLAHIPHVAVLLKDLFQLEEMPTRVPASATASNDSSSESPPPPVLNWSKYAKQYVELHNSHLVAQNKLDRFEIAQIITTDPCADSDVSSTRDSAAAGAVLSPSSSARSLVSPSSFRSPRGGGGRSSGPSSPLSSMRPPLSPAEPTLRMCLHLQLQRALNEERLYELSYKLQPKASQLSHARPP